MHTFALAVVVPPAAGLVKAGFAAVPLVRTLLVGLASGLLAAAEIEAEGVLECAPLAPTAGLVADEAGPFFPAADEEDEADVGLTAPVCGLEIPEEAALVPELRALPDIDEAAVGRATRPTVVPAIRPAAFVVLVALEGAVRPAAIDGLGRAAPPDDDEVVDAVLAAAAASPPAAAVEVLDIDRAEAVVA